MTVNDIIQIPAHGFGRGTRLLFPNQGVFEPRRLGDRTRITDYLHHCSGHQLVEGRLWQHLHAASTILDEDGLARLAKGDAAPNASAAEVTASRITNLQIFD